MIGLGAMIGQASGRVRTLAMVFLCVVAVGAVVAATFAIRGNADAEARSTAAQEGRAFAVDVVPKLLSYDFDTVEEHFAEIQDNLGGQFADQFEDVGRSVIVPSARERQVVTSATVVESSVVSSGVDSAEVLLFINQNTTSVEAPDTKLDGSRVKAHVEQVDGRWLITELTPV